jgi:hypothetical protein
MFSMLLNDLNQPWNHMNNNKHTKPQYDPQFPRLSSIRKKKLVHLSNTLLISHTKSTPTSLGIENYEAVVSAHLLGKTEKLLKTHQGITIVLEKTNNHHNMVRVSTGYFILEAAFTPKHSLRTGVVWFMDAFSFGFLIHKLFKRVCAIIVT